MAQTINKLQVRQARFDSSRMTDLNHWSKAIIPRHQKDLLHSGMSM